MVCAESRSRVLLPLTVNSCISRMPIPLPQCPTLPVWFERHLPGTRYLRVLSMLEPTSSKRRLGRKVRQVLSTRSPTVGSRVACCPPCCPCLVFTLLAFLILVSRCSSCVFFLLFSCTSLPHGWEGPSVCEAFLCRAAARFFGRCPS